MATKRVTLAAPAELERICKGLATLDAIMSEDWESRYYSFNKKWGRNQRLASMRNGCGDDWFIVFTAAGVLVKAFWHEHPREDAGVIYAGLPAKLAALLPSFEPEVLTFGGWHAGRTWTLRGNAKPLAEELAMLSGKASAYRAFAKGYFEETVPLPAIDHVLAGKPLDAKLLAKFPTERTLADLKADLAEIGY
jgi:hypothetical protein